MFAALRDDQLPATAVIDSIRGASSLAQLPFEAVTPQMKREVYDVPYVQLSDESGGMLWVTRHGWRHLDALMPERWFLHKQYRRIGRRLSDGSGAVYRFDSHNGDRKSFPLVVKFSRFAQDVQFDAYPSRAECPTQDCIGSMDFNDPFQEFGLLEELRAGGYGPPELRILTKRPLAIYSPGRRFDAWQLGRSYDTFRRHQTRFDADQRGRAIAVDSDAFSIERQYVMLFHWVRGVDAQTLLREGKLTHDVAAGLVRRVHREIGEKGFCVPDTKPGHIIVRHGDDRGLVRLGSEIAYALVDFELLQRTAEHEQWRRVAREA